MRSSKLREKGEVLLEHSSRVECITVGMSTLLKHKNCWCTRRRRAITTAYLRLKFQHRPMYEHPEDRGTRVSSSTVQTKDALPLVHTSNIYCLSNRKHDAFGIVPLAINKLEMTF